MKWQPNPLREQPHHNLCLSVSNHHSAKWRFIQMQGQNAQQSLVKHDDSGIDRRNRRRTGHDQHLRQHSQILGQGICSPYLRKQELAPNSTGFLDRVIAPLT